MFHAVRAKLPHVLAASVAACLLLQAPVAASPDGSLREQRNQAERRSERVDEQLDSTRSRLAETRREQEHTRATLREIDAEQTALAAELAELEADLKVAEGRLAEAETALRRTQAEIDVHRDELAATERDLQEREDLLRARARASYMHGGISYAEAVLDIDTANELGTSLQYMRTMIAEDKDKIEEISTLEREYEGMIARLDELQRLQDAARADRSERRDEVAGLVASRREVEQQLAARAQEHRALFAELDSDADRYRAAIDDLEAEGQAIERRLAGIAAKQRSGGTASTRRAASGFQWPVNGPITSGYGYRTHPVLGYRRLHSGTDFGAASGTPIVAASGGVVVTAGWLGGYGNVVVISHGGGLATLYGHQSRLAVGPGARVRRGQVVGYVGSTGISTGPHLHFEVRVDGVTTDPARYL